MTGAQRSPAISARGIGALIAVATIVTLVVHAPVVRTIGDAIPAPGFGDPYIQAWQVAWGGHALTEQPLDYFEANTFYPEPHSLAFTDALIGYAPTAIAVDGPGAAVTRYSLLFLFSYVLAFVGAALLAREFGARPTASLLAGAIFAFAPFRIDQATHLHVISSGGIPLALFLLWRGYRRESSALLVGGWAVSAWQVSLGFTLGLPFTYLLAPLVVGGAIAWWSRGEQDRLPSRSVLAAAAVGLASFLLWMGLQALPYLQVEREHPQAAKPVEEVEFFSPPASGFLSAPEGSALWGTPTAEYRAELNWPTEQSLFPGVVALAFAGIGLSWGAIASRGKALLAGAIAITGVLALGFRGPFGGRIYELFYDLAPGWQAIRTPGRLATFTMLALALLAALGADVFSDWVRTHSRRAGIPALAVSGLVAFAVLEGTGGVATEPVPPPPLALGSIAAPQFHLPTDEINDRLYTFWSTDGFPPIVNGLGSFTPDTLGRLRSVAQGFPDPTSVEVFRELGIRTVVVHADRYDPGLLDALLAVSPEQLGMSRTEAPGVVIFDLQPGT